MKLAYFPNQCSNNSREPLNAFLKSARSQGFTLAENRMDADVAVIWSVLWQGRMRENRAVYDHYRHQGKPVIIVEVGALNRGVTWKVAVNNITADGYYGHRDNLDLDRPGKLGLRLATQSMFKPEILIAAQHKNSLQVEELVSIEQWIYDTIATLPAHKPIVIRPHPRCRLDLEAIEDARIETPVKIANTYDSYDIDYGYELVVNYNSGVGIQAALAGANILVDKSSLAYGITDREQWLIEIAHTEYTVDELASGLWYPRLLPALKK